MHPVQCSEDNKKFILTLQPDSLLLKNNCNSVYRPNEGMNLYKNDRHDFGCVLPHYRREFLNRPLTKNDGHDFGELCATTLSKNVPKPRSYKNDGHDFG